MLASQRGRDISAGAALTVDRDRDKNPVVALREIAEETVDPEAMRESILVGLQRYAETDEPDEGEMIALDQPEPIGPAGETVDDLATAGAAAGIQVVDAMDIADDLPPEEEL
jgi:DNA-directed RNA polymerase subunit omega